jgi:hypothetical protein
LRRRERCPIFQVPKNSQGRKNAPRDTAGNAPGDSLKRLRKRVLEVRFGDVPFAVNEEIICCNDLSRLDKAHRQALLITSVDAFEL